MVYLVLLYTLHLLASTYLSVQSCVDSSPETLVCDSFDDMQGVQCPNTVSIYLKPPSEARILKKYDFPSTCVDLQSIEINAAINGIEKDAFSLLVNVSYISLKQNDLSEIKEEWFSQNLKLRTLYITYSGITNIEENSFMRLSVLKVITLDNNNLTAIKRNVFEELPYLHSLRLSRNQISLIENGALSGNPNLSRLNLDHNSLSTFVASEILQDSLNIEVLWLHKNLITELNAYMLEGLRNLTTLNIGFNEISFIEPQTFTSVPNLLKLLINDNKITQLSGNILPSGTLSTLEELHFGNNRLTYLSSSFFHRLPHLKRISVAGNPWQCECLSILLGWITSRNISYFCDREFFKGLRPVCVFDSRTRGCNYIQDNYFYQSYSAQISLYPKLRFCEDSTSEVLRYRN